MPTMPDHRDPNALYLVAREILACACEALSGHADCGCPEHSSLVPGGDIVIDYPCGQLWVAWNRSYPSNRFPDELGPDASNQCFSQGVYLATDFEIGLARCTPAQDASGTPPTTTKLDAAALTMYQDMLLMVRSVTCCLRSIQNDRSPWQAVWGDVVPIAAEGSMMGPVMSFTIGMPLCPCVLEVPE